MARYTIRPRGEPRSEWDSDDCPRPSSIEVNDRAEVNTGLVSVDVHPIYRVQPPVGFGRDEEW